MSKDFFDEEYDKKVDKDSSGRDGWFNQPAPKVEQVKPNRPFYIAGICLILVLCIALGWLLCTVFQGAKFDYNTDGNGSSNYGADIIDTVIDYLKNRYYLDISNEKWLEAIEYSGTALMQKAGDKYSRLMSPQTYYNFLYPTSSANSNEIFGVSYLMESGVGLYVSSVVVNSGAYGKLQQGDVVLKLSNIVDDDGNAPVVDGQSYPYAVVGECSTETISELLTIARKADFLVLRMEKDDFEVFTVTLTRGKIATVVTDHPYSFIEFYFGDGCSNVSLPTHDVSYSTYDERRLDLLPKDTGYVRITEFMDYALTLNGELVLDEKGDPVMVSAADEFAEVMEIFKEKGFKHLVLDLKGNPGGNVAYVSNVAAMLVTDSKLSDVEKALVNNKDGLLITTLDLPKFNVKQSYSRVSSYEYYFGVAEEQRSIVVWTDSGSASASELLTGALTDYQTAVQMGTTTYGKGIAQTWEKLPFYGTITDVNGKQKQFNWAIYYTCASYYSPLGINIHGYGYTPDAPYNKLTNYEDLWNAAKSYWNVPLVEQAD